MTDPRGLSQRLDFCLRVGEMLMSSGAGAADVAATMRSLAAALDVDDPQVDITFTSLSMGVQARDVATPIVQMRMVHHRELDYEDLTSVDHLVRAVVAGTVELTEARLELARIVASGHARPRWSITLGWGVMGGAMALMLGGNAAVVAVAAVSAVCIDRFQHAMSRNRMPNFYQQIGGGAIATVLAAAGTRLAEVNVHLDAALVVAASIIMLLAGVGFMGAVQDALSGYYVTGSARGMEAMLATVGIIAGVSGGLAIATVLGIGLPELNTREFDLASLSTAAVGAAVGAAAFGWSAYAPKRILAPIGLLAGLAMVAAQLVEEGGFGRAWSVAVAAFLVGVGSYAISGRLRVPPLITAVSAMVPLLPGLSIYQGLFLLAEEGGQRVGAGLLSLFTAVSVAIALAAGVILGEYVAQPVRREARRVESRLAGPRLVGVNRVARPRRSRRQRSGRRAEPESSPGEG